jgi:hypothetical protein
MDFQYEHAKAPEKGAFLHGLNVEKTRFIKRNIRLSMNFAHI